MKLKTIKTHVNGFASMVPASAIKQHATTEEYAQGQRETNVIKVREFLVPILERLGTKDILDVGCGVGTMVNALNDRGFEAYGIDLLGLEEFWTRQNNPTDRFFIVDPFTFELPFEDQSFDLAFSFGVIEHVGTTDGHSDRMPNYHEIRAKWLREIFRSIKVGGYLLMGGPNRNFPIDVAHGLDSQASSLEHRLSDCIGASVHKTWGENFLWGYHDFPNYLNGLSHEVEALSIKGLLEFGRVPRFARGLVRFYVHQMPRFLVGTAFNPWVMALVKRTD